MYVCGIVLLCAMCIFKSIYFSLTDAQKVSSGRHCCFCAESAPPTEQSAHEKQRRSDASTPVAKQSEQSKQKQSKRREQAE